MIKKNLAIFLFVILFLSQFQPSFAKDWKRAYLASYPRSGNHWVRFLVEEATHIATGAVYCDKEPQHMHKVFPWGGYCCENGLEGECRYPTKDDMVFIKTHYPSQSNKISEFDRRPYQVTVLIVRHPVDSIYSRYVRRPHGELKEIVPSSRVKEFIMSLRRFYNYWNKKENVITIRYEDILEDPARMLRKILVALNYEFTDEDIERAVAKHPPQGFMLKHRHHFSDESLELISKELGDYLKHYHYKL